MMVFLAAERLALTWKTCLTTTALVRESESELLAFDFFAIFVHSGILILRGMGLFGI